MAGHERDPKRERFWRRALARRARSGLTVREFCVQHGLVATTFQHWRREIARRDAQQPAAISPRLQRSRASAFVPVKLADVVAESRYPAEISLPTGVTLRVAASIDRHMLTTLLEALSKSC